MKLDAPQVLEGYFWLPDDTEKRLSGRLRISEVGKCSLELLGFFGRLPGGFSTDSSNLPTVHGLIEGGAVTLYDCHYQNRNIGFGTVSRAKLHVGTAFKGAHLPPEAEVQFCKLEAAISGLDEWLQITGITTGFELDEAEKVRSAFVRYVPPPKIELKLPGLRVAFEFAWTAPGFGVMKEAKITHQARLTVVPDGEMAFEDLNQLLGRVVNFLSFAADQTLSVDALYAYSPAATMSVRAGEKPLSLPVFYESSTPTGEVKVDQDNVLFSYPDVADQLERMLTEWLDQHEALGPAFNLYFAVSAGRHVYLESAFLSIAQGVETLHDRASGETLESPEAFAHRVERILAGCPEEFREWLAEELAYANKPSLRARLRRMLKPFAAHFGNAEARKEFVDRMVDTRNYLTHYDPALAERAAHGVDIYYLTAKLEALFQLHLLTMIGISRERIEHLIASNRKTRHRLGFKD
jgi:hypothetical protein